MAVAPKGEPTASESCAFAPACAASRPLGDQRDGDEQDFHGRLLQAWTRMGRGTARQQPKVPTARELGSPEVAAGGWLGVGVAKGTPGHIAVKLHETTRRAVLSEPISTRLRDQGLEVAASGPREFETSVRAEVATWRPLIRKLGSRIDN